MTGFAGCLGCETLHPRRELSYPTCFIGSKTPPRHGYHWRRQNLGLPIENRRPNPMGTQIQCLLRRGPAHVTYHSHWCRGQNSLGHCLGTHSNARCTGNAGCGSQVRLWRCLSSTQPGTSPEDTTPESIHILLPPHELGSTEIYADSTVHPPNRRFFNVIGISLMCLCRAGRQVEN